MKNFLIPLLGLLFLWSCSKNEELPTQSAPPESFSGDQFTFYFEQNAPDYVTVNSNEDGRLIGSARIVLNEEAMIGIPSEFEQDLYNVNLIYDRRLTYLPVNAEVVSYMDMAPGKIEQLSYVPPSYGYKKFQYLPAAEIDSFINRKNNYFARDGYVELSVRTNSDPLSLVFLKLRNENVVRYHFDEDPAQGLDSMININVSDLPVAGNIQRITQDNDLEYTRTRLYARRPGATTSLWTKLYDSYETAFNTDRYFDFPYLDGLLDYYSYGHFYTASGEQHGYFTKGLVTNMSLIPFQLETSDERLSSFSQSAPGADIVCNSFYGDDYEWHIINDNSNGASFKKPVFSDEIIQDFPQLAEEGTLQESTMYYFRSGNAMEYQEIVLPQTRILGHGFGTYFRSVANGHTLRYPEYNYVKVKH